MISGGQSSHSRGRSLDAEVNLVPFIDLLSMCICFLLMTAVWIQIGALEVKQSHGTEAAPAGNAFELELKFTGPKALELSVKRNGKLAKKAVVDGISTETLVDRLDAVLEPFVLAARDAKETSTQLSVLISSAMITPKVGVSYGDLVATMDVLRKHQVINLGVVPAGGA